MTLLEIVLVVAIMAALMGMAIPATAGLRSESRLRSPASALCQSAAQARRHAIESSIPIALHFESVGWTLDRPPLAGSAAEEETASESHPLDGEIKLLLRRWGSQEWEKPEGWVWWFQPSGLCEPISVRFERGAAWIEMDFHAVTATVREERYSFP